MKHSRRLRAAGAVAALAAAGAVATAGTVATADVAKGPEVGDSIKIKGNSKPRFVAPDVVAAGQELEIVNKSNPQAIGPHSFSLVEKEELPKGRDELRRCFKLKDVCKQIAASHGVFPPNDFEVDEPDVDNGLEGWDTRFEGSDHGDSWFTAQQDETTSRPVTAAPGNMWFMCVVHPDMRGKVEVEVIPSK
jgi:hypothetical protein